jgi:hypothetical protein
MRDAEGFVDLPSWWLKALVKLGLDPELHLRKAAVTAQTPAAAHTAHRFLEDATCTTFALLFFLVRWSAPTKSSRVKLEDMKVAWSLAFRALLDKYVVGAGAVEWSVFVDIDIDVAPGVPLNGRQKIRLPLQDGFVNLIPLLEVDDIHCQPVLQKLGPYHNASRVGIEQFCFDLELQGNSAYWLWKQILQHITNMVESAVIATEENDISAQEPDAETAAEVCFVDEGTLLASNRASQTVGRKASLKRALVTKLWTAYNESAIITKYFFSMRAHFSDQRVLTFACDASNIGNKNRMLGFICRPDNIGAWLPPLDFLLVWDT